MSAAANRNKKGKRPWIKWVLIILLAVAGIGAFEVFGPNTGSFTNGEYLYIRTGSTYDDVKKALNDGGFVRDFFSFDVLARQAGYPNKVGAGKYRIKRGMSTYNIVKLLRSHRQTPVKLVVKKIRTKADFIRLVSNNLEADSNVMMQMFADPVYLAQFGLDTNTAMCAILPNTYEFYWNVTADQVYKKIEKNYVRFWTGERKNAAQQHGLTPAQAIVMASIIEEETNNNTEKPKIASVYLNRLKKGVKLQADPTAKFAYGDFTLRRITNVHTSIPSPYNTYYVTGLPPGPICTPSEKTIDAVIFSPPTTYMYFCANTDGSGTHLFASTFEEHLKNARAFYKMENNKGVH
jgi:UPF0755 protein